MQQVRVVNVMRSMEANSTIDLECLHHNYQHLTRLYRGRPEMVVMRMSNGRNVQVFRGGKIQILGPLRHENAEKMRLECIRRLRALTKMSNVQVTPMEIVNIVLKFRMKTPLCLRKIAKSDSDLFYEVELFPAALLSKWHPIHVALFHNGEVIVTGLKSFQQVHDIISDICDYVSQQPSHVNKNAINS